MAPVRKPAPRKHSLIGLQPGNHAIVSGASGRGKTEWTVDAILGEGVHAGLGSPWDAAVVCCDSISLKQGAFKRLQSGFTGRGGVTMIEGLPTGDGEADFMALLEKNHNNKMRSILVIDDLMVSSNSGAEKRLVDKLFTSARHLGTDVYQLTQAHTDSRTRRLQCGYLVAFGTPADTGSLAHIARSISPETGGHGIMACYRNAVAGHNGHGCLVVCLNQPPEIMLRNTDMREAYALDE